MKASQNLIALLALGLSSASFAAASATPPSVAPWLRTFTGTTDGSTPCQISLVVAPYFQLQMLQITAGLNGEYNQEVQVEVGTAAAAIDAKASPLHFADAHGNYLASRDTETVDLSFDANGPTQIEIHRDLFFGALPTGSDEFACYSLTAQ